MEIKGKVHCFFEQSGTFKNEFIKLGIPAEDYDIQNNFGQTDHVIDLFHEIEEGYEGRPSVFDSITPDDLIMAFFPCIMFSCIAQINITIAHYLHIVRGKNRLGDYILGRIARREQYYQRLVKLYLLCYDKSLRLIIENPYAMNTFLKGNFIAPPSVIDEDRTRRGDYFVKPTAYWYVNCNPTNGFTHQRPKERKFFIIHSDRGMKKRIDKKNIARSSSKAGLCSKERSMISPDYARNFICDFILGREQPEIDRQPLLQFKEDCDGQN